MATNMLDRGRLGGMRTRYVIAAIACFFATMWILGEFPHLDQTQAWSALKWLIGTIGIAVAGDTARPSGQKGGAFAVTSGNGVGASSS